MTRQVAQRLAAQYDAQIVAYLGAVRAGIEQRGLYRCGEVMSLPPPADESVAEHEWCFTVFIGGSEHRPSPVDLDVRVVLMDSEVQDYLPGGANFGLEVRSRAGTAVTGCVPNRNREDGGWVPADSPSALLARYWVMMRGGTPEKVAAAVHSYGDQIFTGGSNASGSGT